jgi:hypothetical protein
MPWNSLTFMQQVEACGNRYELEDSWYTKAQWGDRHKYSLNAWNLYRQASTNALGMLLLGDGKIRRDKALLSNFGVSTVGGAWDAEEKRIIKDVEAERAHLRAGPGPGLRDAPAVQGPGSVLSEVAWTPLLNDAYILGGAHGGHEFHLALEDVAVTTLPMLGKSLALKFALLPQTDPKEKWRAFFNTYPDLFWDPKWNTPRVLVRELIGLRMCGYVPRLFATQLSFSPTRADSSTLGDYLDALTSAAYRSKNRVAILDLLSQFFFAKPRLLSA